MPEIALDSTPFQGRTSSLPWRLPHDPLECRRCGSSLAGRRQAVRNDLDREAQQARRNPAPTR